MENWAESSVGGEVGRHVMTRLREAIVSATIVAPCTVPTNAPAVLTCYLYGGGVGVPALCLHVMVRLLRSR